MTAFLADTQYNYKQNKYIINKKIRKGAHDKFFESLMIVIYFGVALKI